MVAGSNPVSPTTFRQVKCYFYLLPKPARPVHLIRCQRRPGIAVSLPGTKPALTCVFCPDPTPGWPRRVLARVVTRKSVDGGRPSRSHRRNIAVEQGFSPRGARRPVMTAAGLVVTDLSHLASDCRRRVNRWDLPWGRREAAVQRPADIRPTATRSATNSARQCVLVEPQHE